MNASSYETAVIGGLEPFSSCDWPGKLSAVVFLAGCPWRCTYCHNPHLWTRNHQAQSWTEIHHFLLQRRGLLDGVVFSGGEPLSEPALRDLMLSCRAQGFQIGLHTGGAYPKRLEKIIDLVDWVGLDIKTEFSDYPRITLRAKSGDAARQSLELLLASNIKFECRTSIHPEFHNEAQLASLASLLSGMGVRDYHWQSLRLPDSKIPMPTDWPSPTLQAALAQQFSNFSYRQV